MGLGLHVSGSGNSIDEETTKEQKVQRLRLAPMVQVFTAGVAGT